MNNDLFNKTKGQLYLDIADSVAMFSPDPSTKSGAITVDKDGVISCSGFNDFPEQIPYFYPNNTKTGLERLETRELKYKYILHAEEHLICSALRNRISLVGHSMYINWLPCSRCAKLIIQSGITKVVTRVITDHDRILRWKDEHDFAKELFKEAGIWHYELPHCPEKL